MEFGITFKGDIDPKRTVALCQQAEQAGFTYAWFFDSHVLWRECYVTMAMCMEHTEHDAFRPLRDQPRRARVVGRRQPVRDAGDPEWQPRRYGLGARR